jgi:peptidyl-prolyl cis-trans isomerase C
VSRSQISVLPMTAAVVSIDDVTFTRADLERSIAQHAVVAGIPPSAVDAPTRDALEAPAYEKIVERFLLSREAKQRALWPTDDEVTAAGDNLKKTIPAGKTFADALQSMGTDEKSFLADLASDVAIGKLFEAMKKESAALNDAALHKVYDENKDKFTVPDSAAASHILARVAADAKPDEVKTALDKAKAIRKEVVGTDEEAFKKVAREKSEDPSARQNSGSLGSFARGDMLPAFEEAAFRLKEGAISEPIRTDFGWHIIRGGGSKKGGLKSFAEMKPMIAQREEMKGFMDKVDALIADLRRQAKIVRVHEPLPSPFAEEGPTGGSQVPPWRPSGGNASPGALNPHR